MLKCDWNEKLNGIKIGIILFYFIFNVLQRQLICFLIGFEI
jgi:hypothetical protein